MNAVYLSTNGDSVTRIATTLKGENYGCGVVEMYGKIFDSLKEEVINEPMEQDTIDTQVAEETDVNEDIKHDEFKEKRRKKRSKITKKINKDRDLYLCCNIIEESFVNNVKLPVLRYLKRNSSGFINSNIDHIIWLNVIRPEINEIRLYITDNTGKVISVPKNKLSCTLLFIPIHNRRKHEFNSA